MFISAWTLDFEIVESFKNNAGGSYVQFTQFPLMLILTQQESQEITKIEKLQLIQYYVCVCMCVCTHTNSAYLFKFCQCHFAFSGFNSVSYVALNFQDHRSPTTSDSFLLFVVVYSFVLIFMSLEFFISPGQLFSEHFIVQVCLL